MKVDWLIEIVFASLVWLNAVNAPTTRNVGKRLVKYRKCDYFYRALYLSKNAKWGKSLKTDQITLVWKSNQLRCIISSQINYFIYHFVVFTVFSPEDNKENEKSYKELHEEYKVMVGF